MFNVDGRPDCEILICCPYCVSPVSEDLILCPVCNEDMRNDGMVEMNVYQYKIETRKDCMYCGESIFCISVICPDCKKWQRENQPD